MSGGEFRARAAAASVMVGTCILAVRNEEAFLSVRQNGRNSRGWQSSVMECRSGSACMADSVFSLICPITVSVRKPSQPVKTSATGQVGISGGNRSESVLMFRLRTLAIIRVTTSIAVAVERPASSKYHSSSMLRCRLVSECGIKAGKVEKYSEGPV